MLTLKLFKLRLATLASLVLLSLLLVTGENAASACEQCVFPSGGICVGCQEQENGFVNCVPIQETCSCNVSGGSCRIGGFQ